MAFMQFLDTQVVSYAFKGIYNEPIEGGVISSVVASEFLRIQGSNPCRANYYIPQSYLAKPYRYHYFSRTARSVGIRRVGICKHLTDKIVINFESDYEPLIEYCSRAVSSVINDRESTLFNNAIQCLGKNEQKTIMKRFQFLLENSFRCVPLSRDSLRVAFSLLDEFTRSHNLKKNFHNSWNDILILATAIESSSQLITKDNELSRFAAKQYAKNHIRSEHFLNLDFENISRIPQPLNRDSKGYINRGWRARFSHYKYTNPSRTTG